MTATASLPGRTLRIGVTGARDLSDEQMMHLRIRVTDLLRDVVVLAGRENPDPPRLQVLSPLAEGADRLAAECALEAGFTLICPLPFPQPVYEADFKDLASVTTFRALLSRAEGRVLALDGQRGDDEARSYEAVGRLIVRNCDLLIGIWDGHAGKGRGGTADTIRYAASFGPPVVWLHATAEDVEPRWIEETHDLRHGATPLTVGEHLGVYLERLLHPPKPSGHGSQHSLLHLCSHRVHAWAGAAIRFLLRRQKPTPLSIFLRERAHRVWGPWKLNEWFMAAMTCSLLKRHAIPEPAATSEPPRQAEAEHWFALYRCPDARANEHAARYRSSYVWIFLLAGIALSAAAAALAFPDLHEVKITATGVELASLALIMCLVFADGLFGWQTRAIEYRLIAELCRKQQSLAPLAWVVPRATAWATTEPEPKPERDKPFIEPISWVSWLFSAWLRDAALPAGIIDAAWVETARTAALHDLIDDQIRYHDRRCVRSHRAGKRLVRIGEMLFLAVLVLVGVKFGRLWGNTHEQDLAMHDCLTWLGFLGAMLPAFSAAFVGIRAYAELDMLAEQSGAMLKELRLARSQIEQLDPGAPLASQTLGVALASVATLMLEDLEGWARLFRGKVLDA